MGESWQVVNSTGHTTFLNDVTSLKGTLLSTAQSLSLKNDTGVEDTGGTGGIGGIGGIEGIGSIGGIERRSTTAHTSLEQTGYLPYLHLDPTMQSNYYYLASAVTPMHYTCTLTFPSLEPSSLYPSSLPPYRPSNTSRPTRHTSSYPSYPTTCLAIICGRLWRPYDKVTTTTSLHTTVRFPYSHSDTGRSMQLARVYRQCILSQTVYTLHEQVHL